MSNPIFELFLSRGHEFVKPPEEGDESATLRHKKLPYNVEVTQSSTEFYHQDDRSNKYVIGTTLKNIKKFLDTQAENLFSGNPPAPKPAAAPKKKKALNALTPEGKIRSVETHTQDGPAVVVLVDPADLKPGVPTPTETPEAKEEKKSEEPAKTPAKARVLAPEGKMSCRQRLFELSVPYIGSDPSTHKTAKGEIFKIAELEYPERDKGSLRAQVHLNFSQTIAKGANPSAK